jgi:hypothetical protein
MPPPIKVKQGGELVVLNWPAFGIQQIEINDRKCVYAASPSNQAANEELYEYLTGLCGGPEKWQLRC